MDLRRGGEVPSPRVEDAHQAHRPAERVRIQREGLSGSSGGLHEQGGHALLVRAGHRAQCLRQRTGDQQGRDRQEEGPLPFPPTGGCCMLTRGAMPMLAGRQQFPLMTGESYATLVVDNSPRVPTIGFCLLQ